MYTAQLYINTVIHQHSYINAIEHNSTHAMWLEIQRGSTTAGTTKNTTHVGYELTRYELIRYELLQRM